MSEWKTAPLHEVADVRVSNVDKKSLPHEQAVLLCNYMDVYSNDYISSELLFMTATAAPNQIERFRVQLGDVMITKDSETPEDIGIPAVAIESVPNLVCGYHLALLKPDSKQIDSRYLAKQLGTSSTANYFARRAAGSTRYGLSNGTINETPIPLAPLPEQRRIAAILTTLDEVIEATEKLVEKHQQIKAGLMHDLFTRGLWTRPELDRGDHHGLPCEATAQEGQLRPTPEEAPGLYQDSPLGLIPRAWKAKRMASIGEIITGNTPSESFLAPREEGLPFITPGDVTEAVKTRKPERTLTNRHAERARPIPPGSICVVCIGSTIGKLAMAERESVTNQQINSVVCENAALAPFIYFSMKHFMPAQLRREAGLQAVPIVNKSTFSRLLIATPKEPPEAEAIQDRLLIVSASLAADEAHLAKLRQQKQGLMHDLLTGRVRVREESAGRGRR